jgi:ribosome-binding factor A
MARRDHGNARDYPRTARVNELLREILADALEHIDDERIELVTVTAVRTEPDLRHALVYFDTLEGGETDARVVEVLGELRGRLQRAIAREARLKRTPELAFRPDPAVRGGERIDEILRDLHRDES